MPLQYAIDNEVLVSVEKFLDQGVCRNPDALFQALQRSNSSLKRRPKRVLIDALERVLASMGFPDEPRTTDGPDSEAEVERSHVRSTTNGDFMNRALRANLAPSPRHTTPSAPSTTDGTKKRKLPNGESVSKKHKSDRSSVPLTTGVTIRDIGGIDRVKEQLLDHLVLPLREPQKYVESNVAVKKGILLHGPPGCGKTMIARAFALLCKVPFIQILGPSVVSSMSGDSEKALRERFDEARRHAPSIIFFDEIDAIAPKRETSQGQMEKRIVAQLLTCMDDLDNDDPHKPVIVLAATNRPDSLDPALRRGGRFDTEINIGVPDERTREAILEVQTRKYSLAENVDFRRLAKMTAGFVGADLQDLVAKAGQWQLKAYFDAYQSLPLSPSGPPANRTTIDDILEHTIALSEVDPKPVPPGFEATIKITMEAFQAILPDIVPSSKREGFATIPDVSWADVGALASVRQRLQEHVVGPIMDPEGYTRLGLRPAAGVLLWGPPGCGKTLLAKAAAAESKANFISIKGPELLSKFVGDSEAAVRQVFSRARSSAPCVIFFDEIDALVPKRNSGSSEVSNRMVNTLLAELDGVNNRSGIWVIGATNRPDVIDDAMVRPGRFGHRLFVNLPDAEGRVEIFKALVKDKRVSEPESILPIIRDCKDFSGADLGELIQEAGIHAVKRKAASIELEDFVHARKEVQPSVQSTLDYEALKERMDRI